MLLTRCVLFLAFAVNYRGSELLTTMYVTTLVLIAIFMLNMTFAMKVYKNFYLSILELCFLLNLLILSATVYYLQGSNGSDDIICKCTSASISVSLIMFIGILSYHTYLRVNKTRWYSLIKNKDTFLAKLQVKKHDAVPAEETCSLDILNFPTRTSVELREALLASGENQ